MKDVFPGISPPQSQFPLAFIWVFSTAGCFKETVMKPRMWSFRIHAVKGKKTVQKNFKRKQFPKFSQNYFLYEQKLDNHEEVPSFKVQRLTYVGATTVGHVELEHMHIIEWACLLALMDSMSYFLK